MDANYIAVLKKMIAEQGKEIFLNTSRFKVFLLDYTRGEYEKENTLLLQALKAGATKAIVNEARDMELCKKRQIRVLNEDYYMDVKAATEIIDVLIMVLNKFCYRNTTGKESNFAKISKVSSPANVKVNNITSPQKQNKREFDIDRWRWVIGVLCSCLSSFLYVISFFIYIYSNSYFGNNTIFAVVLMILGFSLTVVFSVISSALFEVDNKWILGLVVIIPAIIGMSISFGIHREGWYTSTGYAQYTNFNDRNSAINLLSKAIQFNPDYAEAYIARGIVYSANNDYDQAIADFSKALEISPDLAKAYNQRGIVYSDKGDFEQAIADFEAALRINPNYTDAQRNLEAAQEVREY